MRPLTTALALSALIALSGCGGGDGDTPSASPTAAPSSAGPTLTKAAFLSKGNAFCRTSLDALMAAFTTDSTNPTDAEFAKLVRTVLVPGFRKQLAGLKALGYPSGDEARLDALYAEIEAVNAKVFADPNLLDGDDPYAAVNKATSAYGLTVCGEDGE